MRLTYLLLLLIFFGCTHRAEEKKKISTDPGTALSELSEKIREQPENALLYAERARAYVQSGQAELAMGDLEKSLSLDSVKAENWFLLGQLYEKRPYIKGAIHAYQNVSVLNPQDKNAFLSLGRIYFLVKDRDNSFKYLNAALRLDPMLAEAFFYRGFNYRELNMPQKAIENFQEAVKRNPQYYEAYLQLGLLYADRKDPKAADYYTSALRLQPGSITPLVARGLYYQQIDSFKRSTADFKSVIELAPNHRDANFDLGYNYLQQDSFQKAVPFFSKVIELEPTYAKAYYNRALCYKAMGKKPEAAADFKQARELGYKED